MFTYTFNQEKDLYNAAILICDTDYTDMNEAEQKRFMQGVVKPFTQEEIALIYNLVAAIGAIKDYYSRGLN